jgi:hypothetical protein
MNLSKPTDKEIWGAMDVLGRAIGWRARERVEKNPRGAEGRVLDDVKAELAMAASMELSNTITEIFHKYE